MPVTRVQISGLTPAQGAAVTAAAGQSGLSPAQWAKQAVIAAAADAGFRAADFEPAPAGQGVIPDCA